jgi:hypothetical protein
VTAKQAIDRTITRRDFNLPTNAINGLLALISVQDPFLEKPEETYEMIEDFVIENLDLLLDQTIPMAKDAVSRNSQQSERPQILPNLDIYVQTITMMAALTMVNRVLDLSGAKDMVLQRYSEGGIRDHVITRVKAKIKDIGINCSGPLMPV